MLEAPALPEVARASLSGPHRPAAAEGRGAAAMAEAALLLPAEPAAERDSREKLALWDRRPDTKAPLTDRQTDSVLELKAAAENLPVPAEVRRRAGPGLRRRRGGSAGMCPARADLGLADAGLPSLPPGGGGGAGGRGPSPPRAGRPARTAGGLRLSPSARVPGVQHPALPLRRGRLARSLAPGAPASPASAEARPCCPPPPRRRGRRARSAPPGAGLLFVATYHLINNPASFFRGGTLGAQNWILGDSFIHRTLSSEPSIDCRLWEIGLSDLSQSNKNEFSLKAGSVRYRIRLVGGFSVHVFNAVHRWDIMRVTACVVLFSQL